MDTRTAREEVWARIPPPDPAATRFSPRSAMRPSRSPSGTRSSRSHRSSSKLSATTSSSLRMRFTVPNIRINSKQSGQAIVLIALLILVLFGMLGLAVDSGRGYVDRRDQQTAVDAAALAAGDWGENFQDLNGVVVPKSVALYQNNLRIYSAYQTYSHTYTLVGANANLPQDTYNYTFAGGYALTIVATDTQFNGYEFQYTSSHNLALAFIPIFGGSTTVPISATATAIVGNQRQTPALLTLSNGSCATKLTGAAQPTVVGDGYTNGPARPAPHPPEA